MGNCIDCTIIYTVKIFNRIAVCIRKNNLSLSDFKVDWHKGNFESQFDESLQKVSTAFFEQCMPHSWMGKLLKFKDPMLKLEDIQPILEAFKKKQI